MTEFTPKIPSEFIEQLDSLQLHEILFGYNITVWLNNTKELLYEVCITSIQPAFISLRWCYSSPFGWGLFLLCKVVRPHSFRYGIQFICRISEVLNLGNTKKLKVAMSRLYGGWRRCTTLWIVKNCCTRFTEWSGAFSWSRSRSVLDKKWDPFLLIVSRNPLRTSVWYSLLILSQRKHICDA